MRSQRKELLPPGVWGPTRRKGSGSSTWELWGEGPGGALFGGFREASVRKSCLTNSLATSD